MFFEGKGSFPGHPVFSSGKIIILKLCCDFLDRIRERHFHDNFHEEASIKSMNKTFVPGLTLVYGEVTASNLSSRMLDGSLL